jgi:hypothetical protein
MVVIMGLLDLLFPYRRARKIIQQALVEKLERQLDDLEWLSNEMAIRRKLTVNAESLLFNLVDALHRAEKSGFPNIGALAATWHQPLTDAEAYLAAVKKGRSPSSGTSPRN